MPAGQGLGRREDGIAEAIRVKVKCDTAGVSGHLLLGPGPVPAAHRSHSGGFSATRRWDTTRRSPSLSTGGTTSSTRRLPTSLWRLGRLEAWGGGRGTPVGQVKVFGFLQWLLYCPQALSASSTLHRGCGDGEVLLEGRRPLDRSFPSPLPFPT